MIDADFWRRRRVFLTGHTGFKGAWLSLWLQRLGAQLTGYSLGLPTEPSLFAAARLGDGMADGRGDVRDGEALARALLAAAPEVVIHAAAQSLVRASYADPVATFATNVMGTVEILAAVRRCPSVRAVLVLTSDKCYENREWPWAYRESDPMGGADPYSASKGAAELVVAAMRRSYFPPSEPHRHAVALASARAGNVLGGGDWAADRLLPDLMRAFAAGVPAPIRHPAAVRPWQFVLDPLAGYLRLCEALHRDGTRFAEAWNFGPADGVRPVSGVAAKAAALWGKGAATSRADGPVLHEAALLRLDAGKARRRLGWRPKVDFDATLRLGVEWYRAYYAGADARALCEQQLDEWLALA